MKKIVFSFLLIALGTQLSAQTIPFALSGTSYNQTFDNLAGGLPMGWRVDTMVNKNAGLGADAQVRYSSTAVTWTSTSRGFKNVASADGLVATSPSTDQNNSTDRALAVRQVGSNAGWDDKDSLVSFDFAIANTTGLTAFSLQFKIQSLHTGAKRYNNWIVQYGLGANPSTFTTVTTSPATLTLDSNFSNTSVSVNFGSALDNQGSQVWIRIMPGDTTMGTGSRPLVALDDFNLSWTGSAAGNPKPVIAGLNPADNSTGVAITTVPVLTFDKNITAGTGNVYIRNLTDVTSQTLAVGSLNISGATATLTGTTLLNGKNYAIQFDSTCFQAGTNNSYGIYDTTSWNFTTVSSVLPPVNNLNESFVGCNAPALGLFSQYSVTGSQTWRCSNFGRNDTDAVYMNGFASGSSNDNEDWLVSPAINVSSMAAPYLHFWSKKRFSGSNTKDVLISSNYVASTDPNSATWTNFNINFSAMDTTYISFLNTALNAYKSNTFNVAFKYVSQASGTSDEWSVDDVYITDGPVTVRDLALTGVQFAVLGQAQDAARLLIDAQEDADYRVEILTPGGQLVRSVYLHSGAGRQVHTLALPDLANGLYILKLSKGQATQSTRFLKN